MKFLNHLDINENELKKSKLYLTTEGAYSPTGGEGNIIYDTGTDTLKYWDGSAWIELMNSTGGATYTIDTTDDMTSTGANVGNYAAVTLTGSNGSVDRIAFSGVATETTVDKLGGTDDITIGLQEDVVIAGTLTVGNGVLTGNTIIKGNLTVDGTTTTVNSNTVAIGDNIIVLNSDATGAPTQDAGIEIERGASPNVQIRYNETSDAWEFTNDGTIFCNIPCSSTGTVLSYVKHYADDGSTVSPANAADNVKFVGGTCISTTTVDSSTSGSGHDEIVFNHTPLAHTTVDHEDGEPALDYGRHNCEGATSLSHGDCFDVVQKVYFDDCGHRTHRTHKTYRLPNASAPNVDQNIWLYARATNVLTIGAAATVQTPFPDPSAGPYGMIQVADSTSDTLWFKGDDTSAFVSTFNDDTIAIKAAVKCTRSVIDRTQLNSEVAQPQATINHQMGTYNLVVELWEYTLEGDEFAGCKVEADVCQENFAGNPSNQHITVKFSEVPTTDILVVIHANNNDVDTDPQYS